MQITILWTLNNSELGEYFVFLIFFSLIFFLQKSKNSSYILPNMCGSKYLVVHFSMLWQPLDQDLMIVQWMLCPQNYTFSLLDKTLMKFVFPCKNHIWNVFSLKSISLPPKNPHLSLKKSIYLPQKIHLSAPKNPHFCPKNLLFWNKNPHFCPKKIYFSVNPHLCLKKSIPLPKKNTSLP